MAASDFVSGLYVANDYVDNTYTAGTYVDAGYVEGVTQGTTTLTSSATLTAKPTITRTSTATLVANGGVLTASLRIRQTSATVASSATLTAQANSTLRPTANISGALSFGVTVNATKRPIANVTASVTLSSDAFRTRNASLDLYTCPGVWDNLGSWDYPNQEQWSCFNAEGLVAQTGVARFLQTNFGLSASADRIRRASTTIDAQATQEQTVNNTLRTGKTLVASATLNADAKRVKFGIANIDSVLNFSIDAFRTRNTSTLQATLGTLAVDGVRTRKSLSTLLTNATQSTQARKESTPQNISLDTNTTMTVDAIRTRRGVVLKASFGTLSVDAERVIQGSTSIDGVLDFAVDTSNIRRGIVLTASNGSLTVDALRTRTVSISLDSVSTFTSRVNEVSAQADLDSEFSTSISGRIIRGQPVTTASAFSIDRAVGSVVYFGSASLSAFNTILSTLTAYKIDPYRVRTIKSEGRTLIIEAETRKKLVIDETRLNTIQDETRVKQIKSETRNLEVQSLTLTDVSGTPLDVRK